MASPATRAASGEQEALLLSSLQAASQGWATFDWNGKLGQWKSTLDQSKEAREHSLAARKQLAETTKQFKRSVKSVEQISNELGSNGSPDNIDATVKAVDGLAKECRHTIKSYQEEVDNLTRRSKSSESSYNALLQTLSEMPDPAFVISTALEQLDSKQSQVAKLLHTIEEVNKEMTTMESDFAQKSQRYQKEVSQLRENNKSSAESGLSKEEREELAHLRREVAEYEVEFRSLKNQEITIRKLEARIAELQTAGEEELKEKLEKAQQDLAETEGRRAAEALEREAAMERRVQTLELQLKAERAGREATQAHLLEADEGAGEREAAWEAQRRILVDDAERLRETLHEATRERDELRLRFAALEGGTNETRVASPASGGIAMGDIMLERRAFEAEVSELSSTVNSLREELRMKEEATSEERQDLQATIDSLKRMQDQANSKVEVLQRQLASAPSQNLVESMKRELRVLKRLEYNADDIDAERDPEMTGNQGEEKDLESVLVAKLRRVESDLVKERNIRTENAKQCDQLRNQLQAAEKSKMDAEKLIATLEADLEKAIATPATPNSKARKTIDPTVVQGNPSTLESILDPNTPTPPIPENTAAKAAGTASSTEKAEDDHSVATIVMAQRDRWRARCESLEAERDSFKRELQAQVQASESLKSDNTKLYEKVRYLQNFSGGPSAGRGPYARKSLQDRDLDLEALEQRYEASVDPFRQFSRAERQRKLQEMSPMERAVYIVARTVLGTREMRTALFFYVVAMHLLVFFTTYHWSHDSGCEQVNKEQLAHLPPMINTASKEVLAAAIAGGK